MRVLLLIALTVSALFFLPVQSARACSCGSVSAEGAFAISNTVFLGKVLRITLVKEASVGLVMKESGTMEILERGRWEKSLDKTQKVLLEIVEGLKGTSAGTVEVLTAAYNGGGSCGVRFRVGESYLVYALIRSTNLTAWQESSGMSEQVKEDWPIVKGLCQEADRFNEHLPMLTTSICMRTRRLLWAQDDLTTIRALALKQARVPLPKSNSESRGFTLKRSV